MSLIQVLSAQVAVASAFSVPTARIAPVARAGTPQMAVGLLYSTTTGEITVCGSARTRCPGWHVSPAIRCLLPSNVWKRKD